MQVRKQSDKNFLSLNPKYEKNILFFIFGGSWGALMLNPGERKFQGSKTSSQSRHMYNKGKKITDSFSYMGHNIQQGTNVAHNVRGGLLIDLTIVAIALLLRYTLSMSLKLTDITQWNVGAVVLEQF